MVFSGFVFDKILISDNVTQIIAKKKHNENYVFLCFTAFGDCKNIIEEYDIDKKDSVRITYHIKSKKFNDKYYTNLIVDTIKLLRAKTSQLSVEL